MNGAKRSGSPPTIASTSGRPWRAALYDRLRAAADADPRAQAVRRHGVDEQVNGRVRDVDVDVV